MNYLGHAYLSFGDEQILLGNMAGDHIKGLLALSELPEGMAKGAMLHRKIDAYTDNHPAVQRAKVWFRETYGLYSGAVLDTVFDHFLANDPTLFPSQEALLKFSLDVYAKLENNIQYLPPKFAAYFPHMREHNWLLGYRNLLGVQRSLKGLERRAKYLPSTDKAYQLFIKHYYELNQCYFELIDDVIKYVKIALTD